MVADVEEELVSFRGQLGPREPVAETKQGRTGWFAPVVLAADRRAATTVSVDERRSLQSWMMTVFSSV
jgi:hypothetical protein